MINVIYKKALPTHMLKTSRKWLALLMVVLGLCMYTNALPLTSVGIIALVGVVIYLWSANYYFSGKRDGSSKLHHFNFYSTVMLNANAILLMFIMFSKLNIIH